MEISHLDTYVFFFVQKMDECGDLEQFDSTLDLSLINFSFKVNSLVPYWSPFLTVDASGKRLI